MLRTLGLDKEAIRRGGAKEIEERIRGRYPEEKKKRRSDLDGKAKAASNVSDGRGVKNGRGGRPANGLAALAVLLEDEEFNKKKKKAKRKEKRKRLRNRDRSSRA